MAVGCTIIFKGSEKSPVGVLGLGELVKKAGFPPGKLRDVRDSTSKYSATHRRDINRHRRRQSGSHARQPHGHQQDLLHRKCRRRQESAGTSGAKESPEHPYMTQEQW